MSVRAGYNSVNAVRDSCILSSFLCWHDPNWGPPFRLADERMHEKVAHVFRLKMRMHEMNPLAHNEVCTRGRALAFKLVLCLEDML